MLNSTILVKVFKTVAKLNLKKRFRICNLAIFTAHELLDLKLCGQSRVMWEGHWQHGM